MAKTKNAMKIGKLKSILEKYDNDAIIYIYGGEDERGDYACLKVANDKEDLFWYDGEQIMLFES